MPRSSPRSFGAEPPHRIHPASGFRAWFTEPLGVLTQVGDAVDVDVDVAHFLVDEVGRELMRRRGARDDKLLFLHDWVRLGSYTPQARLVMTKWGVQMAGNAERIVLALAPQARFVRMGVSVAAVALQLVGFSVEVVGDLQPTLERLGVRPAPV